MKPSIVVTNDDGIHSPGLRALAEVLTGEFDVLVVAPEREQSAVGHSITLHKPLRLQPTALGDLAVRAYQTNGTPADCVLLATVALEQQPALVVSGINAGANLGEEVFYSGTVSAAIEAALQGLPAFAISVADKKEPQYASAASVALRLARALLGISLPQGAVLNVNVPNLPVGEIGPARLTRLGRRGYTNHFERRVDPWGQSYFWLSGEPEETDSGEGTDIAAIASGHLSITPMHTDLTDHQLLGRLREDLHDLLDTWQE